MRADADLIAVMGPTASGKSTRALALAEAHGGELVIADALMVYRHFDIGTNKPGASERARVRHHMLDVCAPTEAIDAVRFARDAAAAVRAIIARGKKPIVVVGTYLYYRALVYGLIDVPAGDPKQRQAWLYEEAKTPGFLAREAERIDPESFIEAGRGKNLPRLLRVLEIHQLTGERASALKKAHAFAAPQFSAQVFLLTPDRDALNQRIDSRVQEMFRRGWVEEVRTLLAMGVSAEARAMQAVGYRDIVRALLEGRAEDPALIATIAAQTRQYARRQRSFFKQEKNAEVISGFG